MSLKSEQSVPDLAELRPMFGQPLKFSGSVAPLKRTGPTRWFGVYGRPAPQRWGYMGASLRHTLGARLPPPEEIDKRLTKEPLHELRDQARNALAQILCRAIRGDEEAIIGYETMVRGAVASLETLAKEQPEKVQARAKVCPHWPVLLSLNPQEIKSAAGQLRRLNVGTEAMTPRHAGQRLDPHNFWTLLASAALAACDMNRTVVPDLEAHTVGAHRQRHAQKFWGTQVKATTHWRPDGNLIVIPDWQRRCVKLSRPITPANLDDWWKAIKQCVLEYWHSPEGNYAEALKQIGQAALPESQRRHFALDRVKQALRSLTVP